MTVYSPQSGSDRWDQVREEDRTGLAAEEAENSRDRAAEHRAVDRRDSGNVRHRAHQVVVSRMKGNKVP